MMKSIRVIRTFTLIALACLLLLPSGCKKNTGEGQDHLLTLSLDWKPEPEFGGFYQAKLGNEFRKQGIDIEIKNPGKGAPVSQLVDTGETDFGTTSADKVLIARSHGADVVAIFAVYQKSPRGILVHANRGFGSIKDVWTNSGTLAAESDAWLAFLQKKYGDPVVNVVGSPDVTTFLARPDYSQQCFVTSEPINAERRHSDAQTFLVADEGFNPYVTVLITSGKTLKEKPDMVNKVVAACRDGWRAYLDDPTAANAEMASINHDMDHQTFIEAAKAQKTLIETPETRKNGLGTMTLERWATLRQQLIDLKRLDADKAPTPESCFVNIK